MGVTVVKGRCGSGKSRFLAAHIAELTRDPFAKVIVLTPGQLTFETEKSIIANCGTDGIFGLQVFGIQRLAGRILEETGAPRLMTNAERAVVCSKALKLGGDVFRGTAQTKDFSECLADLITRLKHYGQTPQSLRAAADAADEALARKLLDIAKVFEIYQDICGGRPDAADMFALAAGRAQNAQFLHGAHVVIDGLDSYCPAVMQLVGEVVRLGADTMAAFRTEGGGTDTGLFETEKRDMARFISAAKQSGQSVEEVETGGGQPRYKNDELRALEANLYRYPFEPYPEKPVHISLTEADSISQEVRALAAAILAEAAAGRRFADMAVAAGSLPNYIPDIKTQFSACGIPFFIDERRTLRESAFFDFLHGAMRAAAGEFSALPAVLYSRFSPLEEAEKYALRTYADRYGCAGWRYREPFVRGEGAEPAEQARRKAMGMLAVLEDGMRGGADDQVRAAARFLTAADAQGRLADFCETLSAGGMALQAEYFAQVYEKTQQVLDGIADVFGGAQMEPRELCELFETGCAATKIAVIPPTTDEVGIFDISLARLKNVDVLFAIGVQDGIWPAGDDKAGILSAGERAAMAAAGADVGTFDLAAEKLKVYTALAKPAQRLYISHNRQSGAPSVLVGRIRRIFPKLEPGTGLIPLISAAGMRAAFLGETARISEGAQPNEAQLRICARFLQQPGWRGQAGKTVLRGNAAQRLDAETAKALYGGIRCSATRIEEYYRCPFRHFAGHGLKARKRREYAGDRMDTGTFMHLALDIFARGLIEDGAILQEMDETECAQRMREAAAQAAAEHEDGKMLLDERFAAALRMLTHELVNTALRIRQHFAGSEARIEKSELVFSDFTVSSALGDVRISGKIDRVDTADGCFRVVDYKSSATRFSLDDFLGGVSIQLPLYMAAAQRALAQEGRALQPAGGYYMKIGDSFGKSGQEIAKAARMTGISLSDPDVLRRFGAVEPGGAFAAIDQRISKDGTLNQTAKNKFFSARETAVLLERAQALVREAAQAIYAGDTDIRPAAGTTKGDACDYCDYGAVCMFSAEYAGNEKRQILPADKADIAEEAGHE